MKIILQWSQSQAAPWSHLTREYRTCFTPSARPRNCSGSCRRRSKVCFGHTPANLFCFCFQVPQQAHGYIRNSCIRVPQVCWARPWAFFCKFWNWGQVSMTVSYHHRPVLLSAAGGLVLTCAIAIPQKCGGKCVFLIYPEDDVLNKLCSYLKKDLHTFWRSSIS